VTNVRGSLLNFDSFLVVCTCIYTRVFLRWHGESLCFRHIIAMEKRVAPSGDYTIDRALGKMEATRNPQRVWDEIPSKVVGYLTDPQVEEEKATVSYTYCDRKRLSMHIILGVVLVLCIKQLQFLGVVYQVLLLNPIDQNDFLEACIVSKGRTVKIVAYKKKNSSGVLCRAVVKAAKKPSKAETTGVLELLDSDSESKGKQEEQEDDDDDEYWNSKEGGDEDDEDDEDGDHDVDEERYSEMEEERGKKININDLLSDSDEDDDVSQGEDITKHVGNFISRVLKGIEGAQEIYNFFTGMRGNTACMTNLVQLLTHQHSSRKDAMDLGSDDKEEDAAACSSSSSALPAKRKDADEGKEVIVLDDSDVDEEKDETYASSSTDPSANMHDDEEEKAVACSSSSSALPAKRKDADKDEEVIVLDDSEEEKEDSRNEVPPRRQKRMAHWKPSHKEVDEGEEAGSPDEAADKTDAFRAKTAADSLLLQGFKEEFAEHARAVHALFQQVQASTSAAQKPPPAKMPKKDTKYDWYNTGDA